MIGCMRWEELMFARARARLLQILFLFLFYTHTHTHVTHAQPVEREREREPNWGLYHGVPDYLPQPGRHRRRGRPVRRYHLPAGLHQVHPGRLYPGRDGIGQRQRAAHQAGHDGGRPQVGMGRAPDRELPHHHAQRPDVRPVGDVPGVRHQFGRHVGERARERGQGGDVGGGGRVTLGRPPDAGEAEVRHLDARPAHGPRFFDTLSALPLVITPRQGRVQEQVFGLQVQVDDPHGVEVGQAPGGAQGEGGAEAERDGTRWRGGAGGPA